MPGKAIDIQDYVSSGFKTDTGKNVYKKDLLGLVSTQYNLLFGKESKYHSFEGSDILKSSDQTFCGYRIAEAISIADELQGSYFLKDIFNLHIVLPLRSLKRYAVYFFS